MTPLAPRGDAESAEIQAVALEVGTPVRFVKLDTRTGQPVLMGPNIAGGFVHAAVGTRGYVFDPTCIAHIAADLPGNVQYTAKTNTIKSVALHDGTYFVTTESGSVYQVVLTGGQPMLAPVSLVPAEEADTGDRSVSGKTSEVVGASRWTLENLLRALRLK